MSCNKDIIIKKGFEKQITMQNLIIPPDNNPIDLNGKVCELIIWNSNCSDWNEWGPDVVFYQKIEPNISTFALLFEMTLSEVNEFEVWENYNYMFVYTDENWYRQPTDLFKVVVK